MGSPDRNGFNRGKWLVCLLISFTTSTDNDQRYSTHYPSMCSERPVVAKHVKSQQLHLVVVRHAKDADSILGKRSYTVEPKIRISAPNQQMVFRNLSVCYTGKQWCLKKFRMVISWVNPSCPSSAGELYLYKIKPCDSLWNINVQALKQIKISRVPHGFGGLHKESPLRQLQQSIWSSTDYTDGGLALNPKVKPDLGIDSITGVGRNAAGHVKDAFQIVISGASKRNGNAYMRFLDLSPHFDDAWGPALIDAVVPNGSKVLSSGHTNNKTDKRLTCTCPMHDLTYSVSLPEENLRISDVLDKKSLQSMDDFMLTLPRGDDEWRSVFEGDWYDQSWNEAGAKLKLSQLRQQLKDMLNGPRLLSRGWTEAPEVSSQNVDKGTVIQHTSAHRAAGMERLEKRGQLFIQKMRDDDLSDEEIAECWFNARWCWWNLLAKPAGWRRTA